MVVNRSWDLYRQLAKSERPRGFAEADIDDVTPGRVIHCLVRSDHDLEQLGALFEHTPGAALIYPGFACPQEWGRRAEVWTSDSAKGLDFQIVGVIDAGQRLGDVRDLAQTTGADGRLRALWARTVADQLRVALSRATDTLVLIDHADDHRAAELVERLCGSNDEGVDDGWLGAMEVDDLRVLLEQDHADRATLVAGYLEDIRKLLSDHPVRALRRARHAHGLLGNERSPGAVTDATVRREVWRLRGAAAIMVAFDSAAETTARIGDRDLFKEANIYLRKAETIVAARAVLELRNLKLKPDDAAEDALALAGDLDELKTTLPEAERIFRREIVSWCRSSSARPLPFGLADRRRLEGALRRLAAQLGARHPDIRGHHQEMVARVARTLFAEGAFKDALVFFAQLDPRDFAGEAACYEALGNFAEAARAWEASGDLAAALRTARRVPDFEGATRLAKSIDPAAASRLDWVADVRRLLAAASTTSPDRLTREEHDALAKEFNTSIEDFSARADVVDAPPTEKTPKGSRARKRS